MNATNRDFNNWISKFKSSIADYKYYVDFDVVYRNVNNIKVELNILNSLIGSKTIEDDFVKLVTKYPEILKCIPILLAKRESEIECSDKDGSFNFNFNKMNYSINDYKMFMSKTGLFDLLKNHLIGNLLDYVCGVETGLNSNGRKNRGGHLMEDLVEMYIQKSGYIKDKTYFKEMYLSDLEKLTKIDLSNLSNEGNTEKRFDYVIITKKYVYAIECNFYSGGGSKLNETARSYKTLAVESKNIKGFKFMWITDGIGWLSAKSNLRETFDVLEDLYCIKDLEDGLLNHLV